MVSFHAAGIVMNKTSILPPCEVSNEDSAFAISSMAITVNRAATAVGSRSGIAAQVSVSPLSMGSVLATSAHRARKLSLNSTVTELAPLAWWGRLGDGLRAAATGVMVSKAFISLETMA